jgi:mRNA interferase MazF
MSTQIAVRLPDEMVAFLDKAVADGKATSRAALVSAAVEREMRRQAAETDAAMLRKDGAADDLDALVNWTTSHIDITDEGAPDLPGPARQETTRCCPTREAARAVMTKVTVAPITSTAKGLSSEVPVGPANGLEHDSVISLDNVVTIPVGLLGRTVRFLTSEQEKLLARSIVLAYDLKIALLDTSTTTRPGECFVPSAGEGAVAEDWHR